MQEDQHNIKAGTVLQNYTIIHVLGEGGFGITYLAKDNSLGLEVVIKEYFPNEFAMRSSDSTITAKSKSVNDFSKGRERFKEEAQILAKFNHPSIVKILAYFEANNTAYFVMEYEKGIDLSAYLKNNATPISQDEIFSIVMPILEGLKEVHSLHYLHRDIKPGNILLRENNAPVLIDFGASKLAIGEMSKSITSMLTEGYAPLEQYSTDVKQQGPFTDLYAMAAVIYKMITGKVPPSAQTRSYQLLQDDNDPFVPLMSLGLSGYDENFLKAVDRALSMKAKDRPQNVQEFQADIAGKIVHKEKKMDAPKKVSKSNNGLLIGLGFMILVAVGVLAYLLLGKQGVTESIQPIEQNVTFITKESEISGEEISKKKEVKKSEKAPIAEPTTAAKKIPIWNSYDVEQMIYKKLKAYGGIQRYGFDFVAKKDPYMLLNHIIIGFYDFPFSSGKHVVAVASSAPAKDYDCHACAPKLSFFELAIVGGRWDIEKSYINVMQFGQWGKGPGQKEIRTIKLGDDVFGLLFESGYSNQGWTEERNSIYLMDGTSIKKVFSEEVASSNGGTGNPDTDWRAKVELDTSGSLLYNIVLHKTGIESGKQIDEKIVYKYDGQKYVKQQLKSTTKVQKLTDDIPKCTYFTVSGVKQLNIRNKPGKPSKVVGRANQGDELCVYSFTGKWGKIDRGWISGKYLQHSSKNYYMLSDIDKDGKKERLEWKCFSGCDGYYPLYQLKLYDDDGSLLWSGPTKADNGLVGSTGDGSYMPGIFHDIDDDGNIELIMAGFGSDASPVQFQIYRWTGKKFVKTELSGSYLLWRDAPRGNTLKWSKKYPDTYNTKVWSVGDFHQMHNGDVIAEIMGVESLTGKLLMYPTSAKIRFTPTGVVIEGWLK